MRKKFGCQPIQQKQAAQINTFNEHYLNDYINYHRPCSFPEIKTDDNAKQKKVYRYESMMTPTINSRSAKTYLKPVMSLELMDELAIKMSDNKSSDTLKKERQKLFSLILGQSKNTA